MIDEARQDQLIAKLFGVHDGDARREFDADEAADPDLAALADEMRDAIGALAHAASLHAPPPRVRARVLAAARGETEEPSFILPRKPAREWPRLPDWMPWAIAAGIAVAAVTQFAGREQSRRESQQARAEADANRQESAALRERNAALEAERQSLTGQTAQLREELSTSKKRSALSEVRIATLNAQVSALSKADAVIIWDAAGQRGLVKLSNVPKADRGKDYQLWVIDPGYAEPVSGGILTVGATGSAYVSFSPEKPIADVNKFAISLERSGGSAAPAGPIVFIGE